MHDGGVPRELVVLVEHVEAEVAVVRVVVHRLPRDQRLATVDRNLGQALVLNAVRPPPQHPALGQRLEVPDDRFRYQHDVAFRHQLLPRAKTGEHTDEPRIGHVVGVAIPVLDVGASPQRRVDPGEVLRVNRQPALVRLARTGDHAEAERGHGRRRPGGPPADLLVERGVDPVHLRTQLLADDLDLML